MKEPRQPSQNPGDSAADESRVDGVIGSDVGARLRNYYDQLKDEPVPERFADVIEKLEQDGPFPPAAGSDRDRE